PRARRAGTAVAHASLPGRRTRDRRQRRRDAGNAGRAPRAARDEDVVPRALGRSQRAHGTVEGVRGVPLREEAAALLQSLIRAETVNPPGNEIRAAEVLGAYFAENGIETEQY